MKKRENLIKLAFAGLFAAMITIFILTVHIPIGTVGYIHIADAVIYLAASFLPPAYAIPTAAVGGALADLLSGYPQYIIPTLIIKALLVPVFTNKKPTIINKRNIIATLPALIVNVGGYALTEYIIYSIAQNQPAAAFGAALSTLAGNLVQSVGSAVLFVIIGLALDKGKIKNKLKFN